MFLNAKRESRGLLMVVMAGLLFPGSRVAAAPTSPPPDVNITYYGGPVLSNVVVTKVIWGTGVNSQVVADGPDTMGGLFSAVVSSGYIDSLALYNTTKPPGASVQLIGRGIYTGTVTINPSNSSKVLTDAQVQAELNAQVAARHLPRPSSTSYFAVFFPPGISINIGGALSCQQYCAYHSTGQSRAVSYAYGIHPDLGSGGCEAGCGGDTVFHNSTAYASSTLVAAITNPKIGLATDAGPPMAWFDGTNGYEVNSACDQEQDHLTGQDGTSYVVQKFYSSLPIPSCVSKYTRAQDFSISAASNVLTVARGQSGSSSLSLADTSGTIAPVALLIRRLPAGVTATFSPTKPLDNAGSVLTFNVSPAAARGTFEVVVSGKMGAAVHTLGLALTID